MAATGVQTRGRRVCAVLTEAGRIETEVVVNAAGMWARQFGALAGVAVPLQAAEHYYLLTDTVPGMRTDLPVIEDPDNYGYYRPEGDGMLVGLFEPVGAPWSLDGVPREFAFGRLPPDWERMEPYLGQAMDRIPALSEVGIRTFFCGPESFTSDVRPLLGPAPELDGYFVAAGLNSLGHPVRRRGRQHDRALDRRRRTARRRHRGRHRPDRRRTRHRGGSGPSAPWSSSGCCSVTRSGRPGSHRPAATSAGPCCTSGWSPRAVISAPRRAGSSPSGSPAPVRRPPAVLDYRRQDSHAIVAREHAAVREAVGVLDMSLMAKLIVQGPDAATVLSRLSANDVTLGPGRLVYTQWLNTGGRGSSPTSR